MKNYFPAFSSSHLKKQYFSLKNVLKSDNIVGNMSKIKEILSFSYNSAFNCH